MAKFASTSAALTKASADIDAQFATIDDDEKLELYSELIEKLAKIKSAIGVSLSGGVTDNTLPLGAATSALQSSVQAVAGSDAGSAIAIQGVANGKSIPVVFSGSLPAGTNAIGSITNTSFGISGTLPAFAATPTVNIGTAPNLTVTSNAGANLNTSLLALESGGNLAAISGKLPSTLGAKLSANSISIAPASDAIFSVTQAPTTPAFLFTATIQRAANTTAYTANDVYGGVIELISSVAPTTGQWLIITDIEIIFNLTALPTGMSGFQLYTYGVTPPSAVTDNGAFSVPSVDRSAIILPNGISLSAALARGGGSVVAQANNINIAVKLTSTSLFAYLVTLGAFTPAAVSETATVRVRAIAL